MNNILIVIDMQNDFVTGSLGSEAAQAIVPKVVSKIKHFNGIIIGTLDTHYKKHSNIGKKPEYLTTLEGIKLPVEHCIEDTVGWQLEPSVDHMFQCKDHREFYIKNTFGSVELAEDIRDEFYLNEKLRIELVGLVTDICLVSNALLLRAYMPDAEIIVDASCCAGTSVESHLAALDVMRSCQIDIINV